MWLLEQRERCGADTFSTAMTRTELAAFLNCDRSALSRELSRMQEEGLIELFRPTPSGCTPPARNFNILRLFV